MKIVVSVLGAGRELTEIKNRIIQLKSELDSLGPMPSDVPGMIESGNFLRKNEYLIKSNSSKSALIACYEEYIQNLESLLYSVFEIQNELKSVLHDQSELISNEKPKRKTTRKKSTK